MITLFESFIKDKFTYYKIYMNKSISKFNIALEKMGIKDDFYNECEELKIPLLETIYLIIYDENSTFEFDLEIDLEEVKKHYNFKDFIDGGEIHIEDYEVKASKYNL